MLLKDQVVIVTGSSTGIGEAIARRCAAEGARVLIHGLEAELVSAVAKSIGAHAAAHVDNLEDPEAPARIVAAALKAFGRIDAVCNNAALVYSSNLLTTDAALFNRIMGINCRAPMLMIKAALAELEKNRGCVLNIGSINAYCGEPNLFAYSVSKGALTTLTRNLGDALHRDFGVRINQINPGWVLTSNEIKKQRVQGMPENWWNNLPKEFAPAGRIILPEELAGAAIYWLSPQSRPISGTVVDMEQFPVIGRNPPKS